MGYESPVRSEIKNEILAALNGAAQAMTAAQLADVCPSAPDTNEVAKVAYEMRARHGLLEFGDTSQEPGKRAVKTYKLASPEASASFAARVAASAAVVKAQAPKKKPASWAHPWKQAVIPPKSPKAPRITRPLPSHLQSTTPPPVAIEEPSDAPQADLDAALIAALQDVTADLPKSTYLEASMSEDPTPYVPDPDAFSLEPSDPEAPEDIDSELVDELMEKMVPLPMAEIPVESAPKVCQCLRLPPLPTGYIWGGIKVWIESEHDIGRLTIATHDEGDGAFCTLKSSGHLSFDPGELVKIGQVADALIKLHESMEATGA